MITVCAFSNVENTQLSTSPDLTPETRKSSIPFEAPSGGRNILCSFSGATKLTHVNFSLDKMEGSSNTMTSHQAPAEVFWTAFRALKKEDRLAIAHKLLLDRELGEDLRYAVLIENRKREPRISLKDYLAQSSKRPK
ncbi:MAG: hypothetical protein LAO21_12835 [Acidobacteriia bacterium]|nr:hypothetical protein [Terriglobia bacterium]